MPYSIEKIVPHVISVVYSGAVDLSERKMAVDQVCRMSDGSSPMKLLIDVRNIEMKMSLDDQENFGEYLASKAELKNAKVAVLHRIQSHPNLVINAIAYVQGYYTVDFDDRADALYWLNNVDE